MDTLDAFGNKSLKNTKHTIIGIDNLQRRNWVKKVKAQSALKIASYDQRKKYMKRFNKKNEFFNIDLFEFSKINKIISKFKFDKIINLAAQPSAPYSFLDIEKCNFTQNNNNQVLRNIIWSIKK